jgi:hypothetical protein
VLGGDRLLQELRGRAAQRADRVVHGGVAGEHGHRQGGHPLPHAFQQFQAGHARHLDVGDEEVPVLFLDPPQRGGRLELVGHLEAAARAQHPGQETTQRRVVVDQQDPSPRPVSLAPIRPAGNFNP